MGHFPLNRVALLSLNHAALLSLNLPTELGDYHVTDLGSEHGTWVNGQRLEANVARRMLPADDVIFGSPGGPLRCAVPCRAAAPAAAGAGAAAAAAAGAPATAAAAAAAAAPAAAAAAAAAVSPPASSPAADPACNPPVLPSADLGGQHFVVRMIHNSLLAENGRHGGYDRTRSTAPHAKRAAGTAAAAQAPAVVRP